MTIREKFNTLIKGLVESKVITESQSASFEPIVEQFETLVKESETKAIKASAQVTESRMAEYDKQVKTQLTEAFKQLRRHNAISEKLAKIRATKLSERKIVNAVDSYLNEYVARLLPESLVVDYDRLQKLEEMQKSLKKLLIINDSVVYKMAKNLKEAVEGEIEKDDGEAEKKIKELEEQVAELLDKKNQLESQMKVEARKKALDEKLKDIPALEAKKVRKYFEAEDATTDEIEEDFDQVLSIVKKALDVASDAVGDDDDDHCDNCGPTPNAADVEDRITAIVGSESEEDDDQDDDVDEEDEEPADDEDSAEEDEDEDGETSDEEDEPKNESASKKNKKKLLKENTLMASYINNYKKLNA